MPRVKVTEAKYGNKFIDEILIKHTHGVGFQNHIAIYGWLRLSTKLAFIQRLQDDLILSESLVW